MTTATRAEVREIPAEEYHAIQGLSYSGLKDLAVSPLRYWHKHVNPAREREEPTPAMQFGTALHCLVLEPTKFEKRFACEVVSEDYPGVLDTIADLRQWLKDKGIEPKGTKKDAIIAQVAAVDPNQPILDVIEARHALDNHGKVIFKATEWARIYSAAESLLEEPLVQQILSDGAAEMSLILTDHDSGVVLKGRPDWMNARVTADPKTFAQKHSKTIDQSVNDAIWYEKYHWQAYFYAMLRGWPEWNGDHVLMFVESEQPHEVRLKSLRGKSGGQPNLYWQTAALEIKHLIARYAECVKRFGFGEKPWRDAQEIDPLIDEELKGLSF